MNADVKKKWVAALRSGEYEQSQGALRREIAEGKFGYCCLGVLCDLFVREQALEDVQWVPSHEDVSSDEPDTFYGIGDESEITFPTRVVIDWADLPDSDPAVTHDNFKRTLSQLNDIYCLDFSEIADLVEEQL